MSKSNKLQEQVGQCLKDFLKTTGKSGVVLRGRDNLISDVGFESDEGVDFAIDLSEVIGFDLPGEFNPFVDDSGKGRTLEGLIAAVGDLVANREAAT